MSETRKGDTRTALLEAAADLVAAAPGEDVPLRAICERAGVKMPTLYHYFGSKEGLIGAVVQHGFDLYISLKDGHESTGDPIDDLRAGWDAHVAFGITNPGFYALMYGQISPGHRPDAAATPSAILLGLTTAAAKQGRLTIPAQLAANHILAANIGATLSMITDADPDPALSASMREATINAVTGAASTGADTAADHAARLLNRLTETERTLGKPEAALLRKWLVDLAHPGRGATGEQASPSGDT